MSLTFANRWCLTGLTGWFCLAGTPTWGQADGGYTHVAVGTNSSYALRGDGQLWTWGINNYGQLGDGSIQTRFTPVRVAVPPTAAAGSKWTQVAAGGLFAVAQRSDGSLWTWGHNERGQLGNGSLSTPATNADALTPTAVAPATGTAAGTTWTTFSAGESHVLALRSDGSLWTWGSNSYGEAGTGSKTQPNLTPQLVATPTTAAPGTTWTLCAAGSTCSFAIRSDGTLWSWGRANYPQYNALGHPTTLDGTFLPELIPTPPAAAPGTSWTSVATGGTGTHTLAIRSDGTLWAWGWDQQGELGQGPSGSPTGGTAIPMQVTLPAGAAAGTTWVKATVGEHTSFGILSDGSLWGWGQSRSGQLGINAPSVPASLPYQEYNHETWSEVATSYLYSLGVSRGQIYVTGSGGNGQLGLGTDQGFLALFVRLAALPLPTMAVQPQVTGTRVFPNPAPGGASLTATGLPSGSQVAIYTLQGQLMAALAVGANAQFTLPTLQPGLYLLQFHQAGKLLLTQKLAVAD